jgi:hypothetical protein
MAIRLPLQTVLDYNNTTIQGGGPASVSGGVAKAFTLPQDCDNVVVKFQASVLGGAASATLQTTDDGGTTWWDVARTSVVSNANGTVTAEWLSVPVAGMGFRPTYGVASVGTGTAVSVLSTTGSSGASTLASKEFSGIPLLSQQGRVFLRYGAAVTSILSERVTVLVNSQGNNR